MMYYALALLISKHYRADKTVVAEETAEGKEWHKKQIDEEMETVRAEREREREQIGWRFYHINK